MLSTGGSSTITAEEKSNSYPQPEKGEKNTGDYLKQVKASRPLVDGPRMTSDGRADRCAVFENTCSVCWGSPRYLRRLCEQRIFMEEHMEEYKKVTELRRKTSTICRRSSVRISSWCFKTCSYNSILLGNASLRMMPHILSIYERV